MRVAVVTVFALLVVVSFLYQRAARQDDVRATGAEITLSATPARSAAAKDSSIDVIGSSPNAGTEPENTENRARGRLPRSQLSSRQKAAWIASLPDRETLRREVAENVHGHPASLIQAAQVFAGMLASSRNDEMMAEVNFQKFIACAAEQGERLSTALKVTCFESAKTLSILDPEHFAPRLASLEFSLDDQTRKLILAYDQL